MRLCLLGPLTPVLFGLGTLVAAPTLVLAAVPNPSYSTVIFPETIPGTGAVTVSVTVQKGESRPVAGSFVQVNVLVDSGSLTPGQATAASAVSDAEGHASVVFTSGISGDGQIRLQVHADGVLLSTSEAYLLGAVPARSSTWGHLKAMYAGEQ